MNRINYCIILAFMVLCIVPAAYAQGCTAVSAGDTIILKATPYDSTQYWYLWTNNWGEDWTNTGSNKDSYPDLTFTAPPVNGVVTLTVGAKGAPANTCFDTKTYCFTVTACPLCNGNKCVTDTKWVSTDETPIAGCPPQFTYPDTEILNDVFTYHYEALPGLEATPAVPRELQAVKTTADLLLDPNLLKQPDEADPEVCSTITFYITKDGDSTHYSECTSTVCLYYDPTAGITVISPAA